MRDPRRIERVLTLLKKVWEQQPDVRFNQLVANLQSMYSQENNNYGRREVFKKDFIDYEKTSYIDLFFLEDDKWEDFLNSYWSSIEKDLEKRKEKISAETIDQVIKLFIEAGIDQEQITGKFKKSLIEFFAQESRFLTVEAIVNLVRNFSQNERKELFEKVKRNI